MQSPSRRAFLRGRRAPTSPWEQFCQGMRAAVTGAFHAQAVQEDVSIYQAWLAPAQAVDVHHARHLCAKFGVSLALETYPAQAKPLDRSVLWVDPSAHLQLCKRMQPGGSTWFVQPGCLLSQLDAHGLPGFDALPGHMTVAAWLADRHLCQWETGNTARSGISHVSALLADGHSIVLEPFGVQQQKPLVTGVQRQLVSGLFSLLASPAAQDCLANQHWPCRYRLDALRPHNDGETYLAHLLLGHGGELAWVEWLVLDEQLLGQQGDLAQQGEADDPKLRQCAQTLDVQVKLLFDPQAVFGTGCKP